MKNGQPSFSVRWILGIIRVISLVASGWIVFSFPGIAGYKKPPNAGVPGSATGTSGVRECGELFALAPHRHVGQTVSSRPTFTWFVPAGNVSEMEFQIYKRLENGDFQRLLANSQKLPVNSGITTFSLPDSVPELQLDTDYVWQVIVRCGSRLSSTYKVRAQIELVDATNRLPNPLSNDFVERADQLVEAGLWYDAIAALAESPADNSASTLLNQLLLGLADLEEVSLEGMNLEIEDDGYCETLHWADGLRQAAGEVPQPYCQSPMMTNADQ